MTQSEKIVLILGSGPNAPECRDWPKDHFDHIVAINNAWRVRPDWDMLIYPEDFPADRMPPAMTPDQQLIDAVAFVPAQNHFGGFVYAGATMAYTAAYWALSALRPRVMAFLGCDMVYPKTGNTHFYGTGAADPLRDDPTLRDLGAKSARLALVAARHGCACVNLSTANSALLFPRARPADLRRRGVSLDLDLARYRAVRGAEEALGYATPTGRYSLAPDAMDRAALASLDTAWRDMFTSVAKDDRHGEAV